MNLEEAKLAILEFLDIPIDRIIDVTITYNARDPIYVTAVYETTKIVGDELLLKEKEFKIIDITSEVWK